MHNMTNRERILNALAGNTTYSSNAKAFKERDDFIGDSGIATVSLTPTLL